MGTQGSTFDQGPSLDGGLWALRADPRDFCPVLATLHCYPFSSQLVLNLTLALSWV